MKKSNVRVCDQKKNNYSHMREIACQKSSNNCVEEVGRATFVSCWKEEVEKPQQELVSMSKGLLSARQILYTGVVSEAASWLPGGSPE
jgi:hypothetical protein